MRRKKKPDTQTDMKKANPTRENYFKIDCLQTNLYSSTPLISQDKNKEYRI